MMMSPGSTTISAFFGAPLQASWRLEGKIFCGDRACAVLGLWAAMKYQHEEDRSPPRTACRGRSSVRQEVAETARLVAPNDQALHDKTGPRLHRGLCADRGAGSYMFFCTRAVEEYPYRQDCHWGMTALHQAVRARPTAHRSTAAPRHRQAI